MQLEGLHSCSVEREQNKVLKNCKIEKKVHAKQLKMRKEGWV